MDWTVDVSCRRLKISGFFKFARQGANCEKSKWGENREGEGVHRHTSTNRTDRPVFAKRGQCLVKGEKGSDVKSGPLLRLCSGAAEKDIVGYDSKEPHRRAVALCQSDPGLLYPRLCVCVCVCACVCVCVCVCVCEAPCCTQARLQC